MIILFNVFQEWRFICTWLYTFYSSRLLTWKALSHDYLIQHSNSSSFSERYQVRQWAQSLFIPKLVYKCRDINFFLQAQERHQFQLIVMYCQWQANNDEFFLKTYQTFWYIKSICFFTMCIDWWEFIRTEVARKLTFWWVSVQSSPWASNSICQSHSDLSICCYVGWQKNLIS